MFRILRNRPHSLLFGLTLALAFALAPAASAQLVQGSVTGNVTDSTQAAIPGAAVTLSNEGTGVTRSLEANEFGSFTFQSIDPGLYTLEVKTEGFQAHRQTGVTVAANSVARVDVALEIGQVTETIEVQAAAATLQTESAVVRQQVTEKTLKNMPVPLGRNYQMLFVTLPGFSPPQNAHSVPTNPSRAVRFSVNGTSRSNNNTRIDGASTTNIWVPHMTGYNPALESIETVDIVTNSFDAEQGLAGGAAINVTIKSGTNDIHGSAFEHNTTQKVMTFPWDNPRTDRKPKFIYNQFGGTIGGPIKKNKWFFFASYEGTRESQFSSRSIDVATQDMRFGDLSASPLPVFDPMTGAVDGSDRLAFANNIIPSARIDPGVAAIVQDSAFPNPNRAGSGTLGLTRNNFTGGSTSFFRDTLDLKTNFNLSDQTTGFIRFSFLDYRMQNGQTLGQFGGNRLHPTNSNPGTGFGNTYSGTISLTHVFTPNFVVDGYYGYTLVDTNVEQQRLDENLGFSVMGIPGLQSDRRIDGGWPRLRIDGFELIGMSNSFQPYFRSDPQNQFVVNGNWTKNSHNIRFGTDLYFQDLDHNQPEFSGGFGAASGEFRFRGQTTELAGGPGRNDFNSWGSFLLGLPREAGKITQFNEDGFTTRTKFFSFYVRDRWQINPKLTFSYGIRYEMFPFPQRKDRGLERFDFQNNKQLVCGVGSVPVDCGISQGENKIVPRVGLAYRVTDNTVIRAGYGITNDPFNWGRPLRTNFPVLAKGGPQAPNSRSYATTLREGLPIFVEPDLGNGVIDIPLNTAVNTFDENNAVRGYIQSWNLTAEHRLGSWLGSVGYVATRSVNQLAGLEQNYAPIGGENDGRLLNVEFGRDASTKIFGSLGTAKYDSMQAKLERRFSNGYQMNFAYTWAHGRGFTDEDSGDQPGFFRIPQFYSRLYADLNQDIRQNFQFTGIYELPFGKGKSFASSGPLSWVLGGWQINHLLSLYTGTPFTVSADDGDLNAPPSRQIADCVGEPNRLEVASDQLLFDPSSFAQPTGARFGTCGINQLRGPATINVDAGVFRTFDINERVDIQFRAEVFNLSNTPHFERPGSTNVNSGSFMLLNRIRNTGREGNDQRFWRFGLRLGW